MAFNGEVQCHQSFEVALKRAHVDLESPVPELFLQSGCIDPSRRTRYQLKQRDLAQQRVFFGFSHIPFRRSSAFGRWLFTFTHSGVRRPTLPS